MDEMLDVLNEKTGEQTGEIIAKSKAHSQGIWHGAIHVLILNEAKTHTLLQKRSSSKQLYPDIWDIAVGGHVSTGEDASTAAKRELEEELGIDTSNLDMHFIKVSKESLNNGGVLSNEFVSIFVIYKDIDINNIKLQVEEVNEAGWFNCNQLNDLISSNQIIPHVEEYKILNDILIKT